MRRFSPEKLAKLLDDPRFNQSAIAELAGVTPQCLIKLKRGAVPNANTLVSLADTLQQPLDQFFEEVER